MRLVRPLAALPLAALASSAAAAGTTMPTTVRILNGEPVPIYWESLGQSPPRLAIPEKERQWNLCTHANVAFIVHQLSRTSRWQEDEKGRRIVTDFELSVDRVFWGTSVREGQTLAVTRPGGEVDGERLIVSDVGPPLDPNRPTLIVQAVSERWSTTTLLYGTLLTADIVDALPTNATILAVKEATCTAHDNHLYRPTELRAIVVPSRVTEDLLRSIVRLTSSPP